MLNKMRRYTVDIFGRRFGVEYSRVQVGETPYLDRWILYFWGLTLRLHKFWRGDDDRAPHDHPWWFITFPLTSYTEDVFPVDGKRTGWLSCAGWHTRRKVKAFRFHFRPGTFRHYVIGRADGKTTPFWTFVISGQRTREWGFWPTPTRFIPWREFK